MKIVTVKVKNYRVLKEISVDWQEQLSLIIGKNNCGKTSLLSVMIKLLSEGKNSAVHYDDFNVDFKQMLFDCVALKKRVWNEKQPQGIELYLYIEYTDDDDISNIAPLLMDLILITIWLF